MNRKNRPLWKFSWRVMATLILVGYAILLPVVLLFDALRDHYMEELRSVWSLYWPSFKAGRKL